MIFQDSGKHILLRRAHPAVARHRRHLCKGSVGRRKDGERSRARQNLRDASLRQCRVVVLSNADVEPALRALRALPATHGVLTVSDELTFVNPEIVIALAQRDGRIVFGINPDAAAKAGLTISSRLLRLAHDEDGDEA